MENLKVSQIKKLIKMKVEEARKECFSLANPLGLEYSQLSDSEKAIYDLCFYLDNYDSSTLETLLKIINKMFYE